MAGFPGVMGGDGVDVVGVDNAPLHEVEGKGVEVISQAIVMEVIGFSI
jgi:hypothetical protein